FIIGITVETFRQLHLLLNTVQATGERRREDKVEIGIRTRHTVFDSDGMRPVIDDTNRAGSIIHTPGRVQRCPRTLDIALIRVDYRGVESYQLRQFLQHTRQEMTHRARHMSLGALFPEEVAFQVAVPQAHMRMAAAAIFLIIPLCHERGTKTHLVADFLYARLE